MIDLAHGISRHDRAMRRGEWQPQRGVDMWRATLGIVGLGRIGRAVARRGLGFDMRVIAHEPYPVMKFVEEYGIELMRMDDVFANYLISALLVTCWSTPCCAGATPNGGAVFYCRYTTKFHHGPPAGRP